MLIDLNVHCGRWPFLQYGPTSPEELQDDLQATGITQAHVSSVEAILAPDPFVEERRLQTRIAGSDFFIHAPLVSPMLWNWRDALCRAWQNDGAQLVKILPSYHRYEVHSPATVDLIHEAHALGLRTALLMRVEDERGHYPLMKVPAPAVDQVTALAQAVHPIPLLVLNAYLWEIAALAGTSSTLHFDLAMAETGTPMRKLLEAAGGQQVVFGSHAPFLYAVAQAMKLRFGGLPPQDEAAVAYGNAQRFLKSSAT